MYKVDKKLSFWKDPRTIIGLFLTCIFSGAFTAMIWRISASSFKAGQRSVYELSCRRSCMRHFSHMKLLRVANRDNFTCECENGIIMSPIPSRLFEEMYSF